RQVVGQRYRLRLMLSLLMGQKHACEPLRRDGRSIIDSGPRARYVFSDASAIQYSKSCSQAMQIEGSSLSGYSKRATWCSKTSSRMGSRIRSRALVRRRDWITDMGVSTNRSVNLAPHDTATRLHRSLRNRWEKVSSTTALCPCRKHLRRRVI